MGPGDCVAGPKFCQAAKAQTQTFRLSNTQTLTQKRTHIDTQNNTQNTLKIITPTNPHTNRH